MALLREDEISLERQSTDEGEGPEDSPSGFKEITHNYRRSREGAVGELGGQGESLSPRSSMKEIF